MKVLVCCDSFKGTLTSVEVNAIISSVLRDVKGLDVQVLPLADGGEGSLELLKRVLPNALINQVATFDAAGRPITAHYLKLNQRAYIEVAQATGIQLIEKEKRNPLSLSSYGTGVMIADAIRKGCTELVLLLGGSATVDGGTGVLLGCIEELPPTSNPLGDITKDQLQRFSELLKGIRVQVVTDVLNPLLGADGAAQVFGPQKGADAKMVDYLEHAMKNWLYDLSVFAILIDPTKQGLGAAGGLALPFMILPECKLVHGKTFFGEMIRYQGAISQADVVITGEGCIDEQTAMGKGPGWMLEWCREAHKPVIGVAGNVKFRPAGFEQIFSCTKKENVQDYRDDAPERLNTATLQLKVYLQNKYSL